MVFKGRQKKHLDDLIIIDSQFPQKQPLGFRNAEINEYLTRIKNCTTYAMYPMQPGPEAWFSHSYGVDDATFARNKEGYTRLYPQNAGRIHRLNERDTYRAKLAYSFFLAETYTLLPFLEKNQIPFVFVLYPGGGFGLDNPQSDAMLERLLTSDYFREVIVTQPNTKAYLMEKAYCRPEQVTYIYGGFSQFTPDSVISKQQYPHYKSSFDVCFVAAKYAPQGIDKGYDLFIAAAKILTQQADNIRFHVVGGFTERDIDISDIQDKITFYGYKQPDELPAFYANMDIFVSPNRPGKLFAGNFDGFPLNIDAAYCGVAMVVSDPLELNECYEDGKDIVIVPLESGAIATKIRFYYDYPVQLYKLAARGQAITQRQFAITRQASERMTVFKRHLDLIMEEE